MKCYDFIYDTFMNYAFIISFNEDNIINNYGSFRVEFHNVVIEYVLFGKKSDMAFFEYFHVVSRHHLITSLNEVVKKGIRILFTRKWLK